MNTQEKALIEAHRDKGSGQFGERHRPEADVTVGNPIAVLENFIAAQPDTIEGRDRANRARISIAARTLAEKLPEAGTFTLEESDGDWTVSNAWNTRGWSLSAADRAVVDRELRAAGVAYTSAPVGLAGAREWTPDAITPTSPKVTSKGRTVYVTLPDGGVVDRTSKSRHYTHAVVATPEHPEAVIADRKKRAEEGRKLVADIDEALAAEKLTVKGKKRFRDKDPDIGYDGEPCYNGCEFYAYAADGKTVLAYVWGNSKGETRGGYGPDGEYDGDLPSTVRKDLRERLAEKRKLNLEAIERYEETIKEVQDGTYDLGTWSVYSFSGSAANAEKAARSSQGYTPTRHFSVMPVDE